MLGLSDFAGVVWEGKIGTTTVDINLRAEVAHGHGAALNMPTGTTGTPRAGPRGFAGCLRLPENEVKRVFFARIIGKIAALVGDGQHSRIVVQADSAGHNAEFGVFAHTEIDVAAAFI